MQALGLIETRGLIAAVESADAMLKASEVTLIDKTYVGGGLVSIAVTGGVAAVKSAVEAGAASVTKLNATLLVSQHVIPRPHDEIDDLFIPLKSADKNQEVKSAGIASLEEAAEEAIEELETSSMVIEEPEVVEPIVEQLVPEVLIPEESLNEAPIADDLDANESEKYQPMTSSSVEESIAVQPKIKKSEKPALNEENVNKAFVDKMAGDHGADKAIEFLSTLKVTKLRSLAREYVNFGIAGRAISKADGKTLISEFKKYYEKNLKERS